MPLGAGCGHGRLGGLAVCRRAASARDGAAGHGGPGRPRVGLDVRLAQAVVQVESNYEPLAISPRGAMGLMQIMPTVARTYAVRDPYNPAENLEAGMRHLRALLKRYGVDLRRALAAYNAGEGAVSRYGGVPPYRETQAYVSRIMASIR